MQSLNHCYRLLLVPPSLPPDNAWDTVWLALATAVAAATAPLTCGLSKVRPSRHQCPSHPKDLFNDDPT